MTGWRWLRDLGFTLQVPRPAHPRAADRTARRGWKKTARRRVRRLQAAHPGKAVEVWAEDEARLGLKPITRRVWSLKGQRPRSCGQTRYEWLYVHAFACPATGDTFAAILPRVRVERMAEALAAFAHHVDPDGTKVLVLVVDNAGWHRAKRLPVPANVLLRFLPPCTPQLQPVEAFWHWFERRWRTTRSTASANSGG